MKIINIFEMGQRAFFLLDEPLFGWGYTHGDSIYFYEKI